MHEYVDEVLGSGIWRNPHDVYDLTIPEISAIAKGVNTRESDLQRSDNIRIGTLCATIFNAKRTKQTEKVWKWSDFFPDRNARKPNETQIMMEAENIKMLFGGGKS